MFMIAFLFLFLFSTETYKCKIQHKKCNNCKIDKLQNVPIFDTNQHHIQRAHRLRHTDRPRRAQTRPCYYNIGFYGY